MAQGGQVQSPRSLYWALTSLNITFFSGRWGPFRVVWLSFLQRKEYYGAFLDCTCVFELVKAVYTTISYSVHVRKGGCGHLEEFLLPRHVGLSFY